MCSIFCYIKVKFRSSNNNISLERCVIWNDIHQIHKFWFSACNSNHVYCIRDLHISRLEKISQNLLYIGFLFQTNNSTHTISVTFVSYFTDNRKFVLILLFKFRNLLKKLSLIYLIRKFGNNQTLFITILFYTDFRTKRNLSFSSFVGTFESITKQKFSASREVRPFDDFHHFVKSYVWIVNISNNPINNFSKIVWRNVCCDTYGNTRSTIYQKVWKSWRQNWRLHQSVIKVEPPTNSIFFQISQKFHCEWGHSCFSVAHSSGTVTIDRTKVSVTINKWCTKYKILWHTHHCIINRRVTMWVIFTHTIADNSRRFSVWFVWCKPKFKHRIQDSSLNRL